MDHNKTIYIEVDNIRDHPDNPRRNLGDLTELVDSIRQHGIMQNLTVVPDSEDPGGFVVLIGHRRLAAAREAGLDAIPCIVEYGLSRREQVTIMLEENMQRADLTILEQANGFQMMLDLGETADSIADKTGFSKSTVYHRVNIAKLDQEILENALSNDSGWQLSLSDLYELEKIEDVDKRNEILESAKNSAGLIADIHYTLQQEKRDKNEAKLIEKIKEVLPEIKPFPKKEEANYYGDYFSLEYFGLDREVPDELDSLKNITDRIEADDELFYRKGYNTLFIVKKRNEEETSEDAERQKERERLRENREKIFGITEEISSRRKDFVKAIIDGSLKGPKQKETEAIKDEIWRTLSKYFYCLDAQAVDDFVAQKLFNADSFELSNSEEVRIVNEEIKKLSVLDQMLLIMEDLASNESPPRTTWNGYYDEEAGATIMRCDKILEKWGWEYKSKEERAALDGTSELYEHDEEAEEGSRTDSLS